MLELAGNLAHRGFDHFTFFDRFAFGQTEYDWALHNNLRLDTTANDLYRQAAPIIVESRDQIIALAREVAKDHKWKTPGDGSGVVRAVFEQLSHDAPRNDDEMIEGYRKTDAPATIAARKGEHSVSELYATAGRRLANPPSAIRS